MKLLRHDFHRSQNRSSILVLTLLVLVLISVIVLGLLASVTAERQATESNYQQRQALSLAMLGFQTGVAQLRDALGTGTNSWDDPYGNFQAASPTFFWSVSPGLFTRWSYTNAAPQTNLALFSQTTDTRNTALFNLNGPLMDASTPIIGGLNPPNVSVQTVNVLQDPSQAASSSNRIIGRYAFWIDDESAKINLNVADGTEKYTTNSLGVGYPTEVDLRVLSQGGDPLSTTEAQSIVQLARSKSFHSPREVLSVSGATPDLYTNNVFNLTDYSRSPELNIFGQPKIALLPGLGSPNPGADNMVINGITLLPLTEIYPTPSQLRGFNVITPGGMAWGHWWPLAFRSMFPLDTSGLTEAQLMNAVSLYGENNYAYSTGRLLANYLSGTNEAYQPVAWPVFPGSSTQGFIGKYSDRQIDEIVAQILDLGGRLISSDYPFANYTDYPSYPIYWDSNELNYLGNLAPDSGTHYNVAPSIFAGWLSNQWVIGMGRSPKVTRLAAEFDTEGSQGTAGTTNYTPPALYLSLWQEEWIPGNYLSGGAPPSPPPQYPYYNPIPSGVPITLNSPDCDWWVPQGPTTNTDYWAIQVLTNNQGIDFDNYTRNSSGSGYEADLDQGLAKEYHDPWALEPDGTTYFGAGTWYWTGADWLYQFPLEVSYLQDVNPTAVASWAPSPEWASGELRCVNSLYAYNPLSMQSTADGGQLTISGGFQVRGMITSWTAFFSDNDPVPLESIRGAYINGPNHSSYLLTDDSAIDTSWSATTGDPDGMTTWQRHVASVIPVNVSIPVPANGTPPPLNAKYIYATVTDPLVNKFPGDWNVTNLDSPPASFTGMSQIPDPKDDGRGRATYTETASGFRASLQDPDSYWVPQVDCGLSEYLTNLPPQTLMPRSARLPNVGYLQYIRTGIVPDDETNTPYGSQHGTPFRLLSYAPSTETANQRTTVASSQPYPDWALLDLFYVPSLLYAYGGPYAGQTNLVSFGTYGGSTAGRINPNGCVIYTTNTSAPQPDVVRSLPLQATLYGVQVNPTFNGNPKTPAVWPWTGGQLDNPTSATLAQAIAAYIGAKGPLRMPAEICNVPAVALLRPGVNATRNDLVRQMVGELTTQSNVFSVWTVGQVIQKIPSHTNYGEFENGDQVLAQVRLHLIVERYLDPGADGIYGDSTKPPGGTAVGSLDDPMDPVNHPPSPKYLYRVVRSEEVR